MFLSILFLAGTAFSFTLPSTLVLHEKRDFEPALTQWIKRSVAPPKDAKIPVRIALTQRNPQDGHDYLMDISDPQSPNFGKHWTPQEVRDFFSPSSDTISSVREWLSSSGINSTRHELASSRGYIQFDASVSELEYLLGTQYDLWEHGGTGAQALSCDSYHVPADVKHHIDFITPTTGLVPTISTKISLKKRQSGLVQTEDSGDASTNSGSTACANGVTQECIRQIYNIPEKASAVPGNDLGIYEQAPNAYDQEDLNLFYQKYTPNIPQNTGPTIQSINKGKAPVSLNQAGRESLLDFELAIPLVYPQSVKLFETVGSFDGFLDGVDKSYCASSSGDCGIYKPTNVVSFSWSETENTNQKSHAVRQCQEFMKLGLQGISLIFSSGDSGTVQGGTCLAGGADNPGFPSTCPYITSVGATQIVLGEKIVETAADPDKSHGWTSGGGFSNYFSRPSYQDAAVSSYLSRNTRNKSLFNASGRAFPDVSAVGLDIPIIANGKQISEGGTSASAPIFASVINRINGDRITAGKKPLGFLNTMLYANPSVFNDVTSGKNLGCHDETGFNASTGWDPVTGLGTPRYADLHQLLLNMP